MAAAPRCRREDKTVALVLGRLYRLSFTESAAMTGNRNGFEVHLRRRLWCAATITTVAATGYTIEFGVHCLKESGNTLTC